MTDEKKPPQEAGVLKTGAMEALDYIEAQGQRCSAFSLETLEIMTKRAYALLLLLLAGAGAAGTYALGQYGRPESRYVLCALAAVSLWWFMLAAWVALRALQSREVLAPAVSGQKLLAYMQGPLVTYFKELEAEGLPLPDPLVLIREGEIRQLANTVDGYRAASSAIALALDMAYRGAVCTPLAAGLGLLLAPLLR